MKHLLRKIFFWDEPAQGALFRLTLLLSLPWLLFTLLCINFNIADFLFDYPVVTLVVLALAFLYPLVVRVKSLGSLIPKDSNAFSRIRYQILIVATFAALWAG
ncbi:MAG: hypothetical protein IJT83_15025, partial [Victivallales bacterium]|nr:hypothetical protein [Victivallales bacterium]